MRSCTGLRFCLVLALSGCTSAQQDCVSDVLTSRCQSMECANDSDVTGRLLPDVAATLGVDVASMRPDAVGFADVDDDRLPDIVVATMDSVSILRNHAGLGFDAAVTTQFEPGESGWWPYADIAVGDLDSDGDVDLLVASGTRLYYMANGGDGTFDSPTALRSTCVDGRGRPNCAWSAPVVLDFDGDGVMDVVVSTYSRDKVVFADSKPPADPPCSVLLRGRTDGSGFTIVPFDDLPHCGETHAAMAADIDGDGDVDLVFADDFHVPRLFRNNGAGSFVDETVEGFGLDMRRREAPMGIAYGDVDNDGDIDLWVSNQFKGWYLRNAGDGTFVDATGPSELGSVVTGGIGWGAAFIDLDADGLQDLIQVNGDIRELAGQGGVLVGTHEAISTGFGRPDRSFAANAQHDAEMQRVARTRRSMATADYDMDGDQDVLVGALYPHKVELRRNDFADGVHRTLEVALRARTGNRRGLGTFVTLVLESGERRAAVVASGGSYRAPALDTVRFSLGPTDGPDRLEWRVPGRAQRSVRVLGVSRAPGVTLLTIDWDEFEPPTTPAP